MQRIRASSPPRGGRGSSSRWPERVPAAAFRPRPSVDGGVLVISRRPRPLLDPRRREAYQRFVAGAFRGAGPAVDGRGRWTPPGGDTVRRRLVVALGMAYCSNISSNTVSRWPRSAERSVVMSHAAVRAAPEERLALARGLLDRAAPVPSYQERARPSRSWEIRASRSPHHFAGLLPGAGLRRGSTVAIPEPAGATSLLFALLAEASAAGAWVGIIRASSGSASPPRPRPGWRWSGSRWCRRRAPISWR